MVQKERVLNVTVDEKGIHKIEEFIEEICDDFNIFNSYFGNIMMSVIETAENAFISLNKAEDAKLKLKFWSEKNKLNFSIIAGKEVYVKEEIAEVSENKDFDVENTTNTSMIIKMLTDDLEIDKKTKVVNLVFYISSINHNTSIHREKSLTEYFEKVFKRIKAHE